MKAIVLVAHGSRRQTSNDEVRSLSAKIAHKMSHEFPVVETGFLELAEPLIPDAIERCITQGVTEVCVVPYFLSAGIHVEQDVPAEVKKTQLIHPDIKMEVQPHIGGSDMMVELIRNTMLNR